MKKSIEVYFPIFLTGIYLLITVGCIAVEVGLRAYLGEYLHWINWKDDFWTVPVAFMFPIPFVWYFFYRQVNTSTFPRLQEYSALLFVAAVFSIGGITAGAQQEFVKRTFETLPIHEVSKIRDFPHERYFKLDTLLLDTKNCVVHTEKYSESTRQDLVRVYAYYFLVPVRSESTANVSDMWYGVKCDTAISNDYPEKMRSDFIKSYFYRKRQELTQKRGLHSGDYIQLPHSKLRDYFVAGLEKKEAGSAARSIIVVEKDTVDRENFNFSGLTFLFLFIACFLLFIGTTIATHLEIDDDDAQKAIENKDITWRVFYGYNKKYFPIVLPVWLSVAVFVVMMFRYCTFSGFIDSELLPWGAFSRSDILNGQWWRLVTAFLINRSIMALFLTNLMYAMICMYLVYGKLLSGAKILLLFLLCGLGAGISCMLLHDSLVTVGASSIVCGMSVALLVLSIISSPENSHSGAFLSIVLLLNGGYYLMGHTTGDVDPYAQPGAVAVGLVAGLLFGWRQHVTKQSENNDNDNGISFF